MHRRDIIKVLDTDNVFEFKNIEKHLNILSDPLYTAIDHNAINIAIYMVETLKLPSKLGLMRALQCENIEFAKYLKEKGYELSCKDHVYNIETMKLLHEWNMDKYSENAIRDILHLWYGNDILERVIYLYEVCNYKYLPVPDLLREVHEDIGLYLIKKYNKSDHNDLMMIACKNYWFGVVDYLINQECEFNIEHFKIIAGGEPSFVNILRERYNISVKDMILYALLCDDELTYRYKDYKEQYPTEFKELIKENKLSFLATYTDNHLMERDHPFVQECISDGIFK
jgi:hypothetical protein